MRMAIREANQNLAYIKSEYFLMKLYSFDYTCLEIPYPDVLNDWHLAYDNQIYKNWKNTGEHLYLYRMDHGTNLDLVANTINCIMKHNQHNFAHIHFKYILDKMPTKFTDELFKKKILQ